MKVKNKDKLKAIEMFISEQTDKTIKRLISIPEEIDTGEDEVEITNVLLLAMNLHYSLLRAVS